MKRTRVPVLVMIVCLAQALLGVVPQKWEIRNKDDFLKGKFDGVSVSDEGVLFLSPKEEAIMGPAEEFYLSLLVTQAGEIFLGTGHGGKIYKIDKNGRVELYFQVPEMDVSCLAQDRKGNLYVGTSPNGKIYKITEKGKGEPFFNPMEKYIWDLVYGEKGVLLAAVGENGGIYEINSEGEGRLILRTEDNHFLCLKEDLNGDLLAGTGGKGRVYRLSRGRLTSLLFESPFEEIKSIALDKEGNVYVAASGRVVSLKEETELPVGIRAATEVSITVTPTPAQPKEITSLGQKEPSALFKLNPQGIAEKLWESDDELIYSLLWKEEERELIFGTGDKGRLYSVDGDNKISLLLQKNSAQVYGLFPFGSKTYVLSNNPSSLTALYPDQVLSGEYLSEVIDAYTISSWGMMEWEAEVPSGCNLQLQTRSGNSSRPNMTWSDWSPPYQKKEGEKVLSPKARYLQFKVMLKSQSGKTSPLLQKLSFVYLQTNLVPKITRLTLLPANQVFLKPPIQEETILGVDEDYSAQAKDKDKEKAFLVPKEEERKGFQTVIWDAVDENGDSLIYSILIKKEDEAEWRVLKENWEEQIYAFDTLSFPDGAYVLKVTASDLPSNPPGMQLRTEKISRPMTIDNSLPVIKSFKADRDKTKLVVSFSAEDSISSIKEVKYLIRPDEWKTIFPLDGICDSKQESFKITVILPSQFDNMITVKVTDSHGNIGVHRATF
ncbi:MAG: WD40 repeat domain-containing protein [Candidatus Aminicenantes bacterium]|nr:WD40 repeat domain-containing protein [Candidatus Aminicenantes bacterium]